MTREGCAWRRTKDQYALIQRATVHAHTQFQPHTKTNTHEVSLSAYTIQQTHTVIKASNHVKSIFDTEEGFILNDTVCHHIRSFNDHCKQVAGKLAGFIHCRTVNFMIKSELENSTTKVLATPVSRKSLFSYERISSDTDILF